MDTAEELRMYPAKWDDEYSGPRWRYRSLLRPVAAIADRIPARILRVESDPLAREFETYMELDEEGAWLAHFDIELVSRLEVA